MKLDEYQIKEFIEMFGNNIPDPEHQPKVFMYLVTLYLYEKKIRSRSQ